MAFENPLPWWVLTLIVLASAGLAWQTYRHMPASPTRRAVLTTLRLAALLTIVLFLMRPVARTSAASGRDAVVPILVDTSRSMSVRDVGPSRRIDRARRLLVERLLPELSAQFQVEVLGFGDSLVERSPDQLTATAPRSDLRGAIAAVRDRYRGRVVPGVVVLSDGGDTSGDVEAVAAVGGVPIYPIGVGAADLPDDSEVLALSAADAVLDGSRISLDVTAIAHGSSTGPIDLRLLENGRSIHTARVAPVRSGAPVHHVFRASPPRGGETVYTIELPVSPGDPVPENNTRSVLVRPPSRARRVLVLEGAPGFEHSFLRRALADDSELEVDAAVRAGRDERGASTFFVQAARSRSEALVSGFPQTMEALCAYDALVLANVDAAMLSTAQLEAARAFVARRGGGLLVLGSASLGSQGLAGTPLGEALPLGADNRAGAGRASTRGVNQVALTPDGSSHPIMQIAEDVEATRKRWSAVPPLAAVAAPGGPAPGATVLAVTTDAGGTAHPLIAVQRYGQGRAMVFAGEASWRWRMHMPSTDRTYETFWRQSLRWLSLPAGDPVRLTVPAGAMPGDIVPLRMMVRSAAFEPIAGAMVDVRISAPDGRMEEVRAVAASGADGLYETAFRPPGRGVYRVTAEARRGGSVLGSSSASMLVGGADDEMSDPRLDIDLLRRVALASNGRVLGEADVLSLAETLRTGVPAAALAGTRDLWNNAWSFVGLVAMLASEWVLRRRWGLR